MRRELRARGPILFDFNAGHEFQAYQRGILSDDNPISKQFHRSAQSTGSGEQTQESTGAQWAKLTHSTLVIGYGTHMDEMHGQIDYWIIRNSYGPNWGENGNLRVRRGRNDFGGEAENIAVVPKLM